MYQHSISLEKFAKNCRSDSIIILIQKEHANLRGKVVQDSYHKLIVRDY
jgi:hypothetical protein